MFLTGPPKIIIDKSMHTVLVGKRVDFGAQVTGTPTPKVKWMLHGEDLSRKDGMMIHNQHTLTIFRVALSHSGKYTVEAINDCGTDTKNVSLTVHGKCES